MFHTLEPNSNTSYKNIYFNFNTVTTRKLYIFHASNFFSLHCVCTIFPSFPPEFSPASTELLNPASARKRRKKIHNVHSTQL